MIPAKNPAMIKTNIPIKDKNVSIAVIPVSTKLALPKFNITDCEHSRLSVKVISSCSY